MLILQKIAKMDKKYQVVTYIRVEPEKIEPLTYNEAKKEKEQAELMQPENIYEIEEIRSNG